MDPNDEVTGEFMKQFGGSAAANGITGMPTGHGLQLQF